jgi:1-deoxy-D-xylulose-5-phosphate reductoisomerase
MPCALNAADEVAVEAFLAHRLRFSDIPRVIEQVMKKMPTAHPIDSMDDIREGDREARSLATELVSATLV